MTPEQLLAAGAKPPYLLDLEDTAEFHSQSLVFGFAVAEILWTQRAKTADELALGAVSQAWQDLGAAPAALRPSAACMIA